MPTGPSSSLSPYLIPLEPNVKITSILTTGDALKGSTTGVFGGIPDGIGVFDNGDGTITVIVSHEYGNTAGAIPHDHGAIGAYIDRIVIDKSTLQVISGDDAMKQVFLWNAVTHQYDLSTATAFNRFCSGDLAAASAFFDAATGLGTQTRIYLTGEESGNEGRPVATILTGPDQGKAFEVAALGNQSFENLAANPFAQSKTIVATTDDGGNGQVYIFVGEKQSSGTELQMAGLDAGVLYGIKVAGVANETDDNLALIDGKRFTMEAVGADGNVKDKTGATIQADSVADGILGFQRPEDAAWDPDHPNVLYFVTTNGFPTASDPNPSRLWRLTFDDVTNPAAGGTIEAVLDGTEGQRMFDNITVANGKVIIQEDPGNQDYIARIWEYDIATDTLTAISSFDPAQFTPGADGFVTRDEESSGIIDVTDIFGTEGGRTYLFDAQVHTSSNDPVTVEKGQLLLMTVTDVHDGGNGNDELNGDGADNTIHGYNGNDTIRGGSGHDTLYGDNGNDTIEGWSGDDVIVGGRGNDLLTGGGGADIFSFGTEQGKGFGNDTITDFELGVDTLRFDDGQKIRQIQHGDYDGDGTTDTRLVVNGGTVTLLGVADYPADGPSPKAAWAHHVDAHDLYLL